MNRYYEEGRSDWALADGVTPELERELSNQESLNRRFGGYKIVLDHLNPVLLRRQPLELLDLGAGSGDVARAVVKQARKRECPIAITSVDRSPAVMEVARDRSVDFPEIRFVCADMLTFDEGKKYGVVMSNLTLHDLDETDAIRLFRRCRELADGAALVTDLRRSRLAQLAIFTATETMYRDRTTRFGTRQSVERAFSYAEAAKLAIAAGWWGFRHRRWPYFRQALWMDLASRSRR